MVELRPWRARKDKTADRSSVSRLEEALADSKTRNEQLETEVSSLSGELKRVRGRVDEM